MVDGRAAALFVGRERERAQLKRLITHAHFAMVCGPGGIGKTALVQVALAELGTAARFHRCRKGDTLEELGRGLLQALGEKSVPALGTKSSQHTSWNVLRRPA
jgi:Holliday junction resolvasome RuvABC ATP-dependent DNA helicase subunit